VQAEAPVNRQWTGGSESAAGEWDKLWLSPRPKQSLSHCFWISNSQRQILFGGLRLGDGQPLLFRGRARALVNKFKPVSIG
jgi:hypothetical protein